MTNITTINNRLRSSTRRSKKFKPWALFLFLCIIFLILLYLLIYIPLSDYGMPSRMVPIPGWEKNTTRDPLIYILPQKNTTIIDPTHICKEQMLLLIVVCSSSSNFEIRQSIRETWANVTEFNYSSFAKLHNKLKGEYLDINYENWKQFTTVKVKSSITASDDNFLLKKNEKSDATATTTAATASHYNFSVKIVFLVGQPPNNITQQKIINESELNGDLIQESFLDSYNNLTLKTIMMLKWVNSNCCDKVKFLMKCDDDTFVNIPNLLHILLGGTVPVYNATVQVFDLETIKTKSNRNRLKKQFRNLLLGSRFCNSKPISNTSSKWYTPMYMYSGNVYPIYLSGTGYVMSMDVAKKLYNASLSIPVFHLEDVYLTGFCAEAIKIIPINHQLFSYMSFKNPCEILGMVTKHELTSTDMRQSYEFLTNRSSYCTGPDKIFHSRKLHTKTHNCN